ncbi:GlcG/HbpS family heme-binding protein [Streptomyces sp. T028]|uniref:GlcG/HbpS family heme-binding protein n=1 Tax=Streptomyces sp. T028 TaxID=3394379 RepID=UPI003A869FD1
MTERLSYDIARQAAEATLEIARAEGLKVCVTVVDSSGAVKVLLKDDGAAPIGVETSRRKAYTAAVMHLPTAEFAEFGKDSHLIDSQLLAIPGGHPIVTDTDEVIGGIGVGGALAATDDRLAADGLKSIAALLA